MDTKRLWLTTIVTVFVLSTVGPGSLGVWAQEATCPAGWEWNRNSIGQDPCSVASALSVGCLRTNSFTVFPLTTGQHYPPPQTSDISDLACECNTVWYSLLEACTTCQGGVVLSWINWIVDCSSVYVAQLPYGVPPGTRVPRWAFYNVTSLPNQTYSDSVAMPIGRDPEATPNPISTLSFGGSTKTSTLPSTLSTSTPTLTLYLSSASSPSPTHTGDALSNSGVKSNAGAIVGGVVGSIVPLIIIATIAAVVVHWQREKLRQNRVPPPRHHIEPPASPAFTATSTHLPNAYPNAFGPQGQGHYYVTGELPMPPEV